MYQNTAYWTSIEPNRLTVWPPRNAPTCRRQWSGSGVGGAGVGDSAAAASAAAPGSRGTVQGYRPSERGAIPPWWPLVVSCRGPVDTIRAMAHADPTVASLGAVDLPTLDAAVVDCFACPRLVAWREAQARVKVARFRDDTYWGRPVPGFGDPEAAILIVGLAPAAHGGNRTGRVFTGDSSGDFLLAVAATPSGWRTGPRAGAPATG